MAGRGLNKVQLIGHAGKDTELRYTSNGKAVGHFTLATTDSWKDQAGTLVEKTTWHRIVAWGTTAEVCAKYVKKGKQVFIEGRIENGSYDKDGVKIYTSEVVVDQMILLGGADDRGASGSSYNGASSEAPAMASSQSNPTPDFDQAIPDSDLPF